MIAQKIIWVNINAAKKLHLKMRRRANREHHFWKFFDLRLPVFFFLSKFSEAFQQMGTEQLRWNVGNRGQKLKLGGKYERDFGMAMGLSNRIAWEQRGRIRVWRCNKRGDRGGVWLKPVSGFLSPSVSSPLVQVGCVWWGLNSKTSWWLLFLFILFYLFFQILLNG